MRERVDISGALALMLQLAAAAIGMLQPFTVSDECLGFPRIQATLPPDPTGQLGLALMICTFAAQVLYLAIFADLRSVTFKSGVLGAPRWIDVDAAPGGMLRQPAGIFLQYATPRQRFYLAYPVAMLVLSGVVASVTGCMINNTG